MALTAVVVINAKSGAKSRHAVSGFFRKGKEAIGRRRVRSGERRAQGGRTASPERVRGDGSTCVAFSFSCALQNCPAGRSLHCSSPLRERSTSAFCPGGEVE